MRYFYKLYRISEFLENLSIEAIGVFIGVGGAIFLFYKESQGEIKRARPVDREQKEDRVTYLNYLV